VYRKAILLDGTQNANKMKTVNGVKVTKTEIGNLLTIDSKGKGINYYSHLINDPLAQAVRVSESHFDGFETKREKVSYIYNNIVSLFKEAMLLHLI